MKKQLDSRLGYAVRLSGYIKDFGWYLFFAVLCNMLFKILPLACSFVTSGLISSILFRDFSHVRLLSAAAVILAVLTAVFSYLDVQVSHDMAYRILAQLRDRCYEKLDELAPAALAGQRSGDMISIIMDDVETLEWFYAHTIGQIAAAVLIPSAALFFTGFLSPYLPAVIVPFIIILVMVPYRSSQKADRQGADVKKEAGLLNAVVVDGVQGLKDIISFRWQYGYLERFREADRAFCRASFRYALRRGDESRKMTAVMEAAAFAADASAVLLAVRGKLDAVWLLPLFVLFSAVFAPIRDALSMSTNYGLIFGAAERVLSLLSSTPAVRDTGNSHFPESGQTEVCFSHVSFAYPGETAGIPVLEDLSFSFRTGETVVLAGASGSGKTTAVRLLQRFWDVSEGEITINGTDIREVPLAELREMMTVVPQEIYLFNLSVEENLRLAKLGASENEIRQAAEDARASFIQELPEQYDTVLGEGGLRLSGGEKQRIALAQAFLRDAPVLVLDEASASLDSENERMINEALERLKKGRAVLMIAHRISTIRSADRVIMIKNGKAAAEGTYEQLTACSEEFRTLIGEMAGR